MTNCLPALRKAKGLSQVELALAFDVAEATVNRWERGHTTIPYKMLKRLAAFFNVAPTDIVPDLALIPTPETEGDVPVTDEPSAVQEVQRVV